jgi:TPR repeat protein
MPDAQYNLAVCYDLGEALPRDATMSAKWYRKAAEQGFGMAQYNLAVAYCNGDGVDEDKKLALEWMNKAAAQGVKEAKEALENF